METPTPQAQAGTETQPTATAQTVDMTAAADALTTAIMAGEPQEVIDQIAASYSPQPATAETPKTEPAPEPGQVVEPNKEPNAEPTPQEPTPQQPEPQNEPEDGRLPERIRIGSLPDRDRALLGAATMLAKADGISIEEAFARVSGKPATEPQTTTPAQVEPVAQVPTASALQSKVDEIKAKLNEAGAAEGLFTPEIAQLQQEYAETIADLKVSQLQEGQRQAQEQLTQAQMQDAWSKSLTDVQKDYPAMADRNSPQYLLAAQLTQRARQDANHPLHSAVFNDPNAPRIFADEANRLLGGQVAQAPAASPVPQPTRQVLPASGSKGTQTVTQPSKTREQILAESEAATLAAIEGTPVGAASRPLGILIR